jgi:hypothetical protein
MLCGKVMLAGLAAATTIWLCACSSDLPPTVGSKSEVDRLPVSTAALGVRFLPEAELASLERLGELSNLSFISGRGVGPAPLSDAGLARLAGLGLPKLDFLMLGYCENITDAGLAHVAKMPTVSWLSLMASPKITDAALPQLLTMKNLKSLDLRGCVGITDAGLETLAAKTDWQNILLGGCPNVTSAGVAKLQAALPGAKVTKDEVEWSAHQ